MEACVRRDPGLGLDGRRRRPGKQTKSAAGWRNLREGSSPNGGDPAYAEKERAYGKDAKAGQRLGRIKQGAACDAVLLVLLDNRTLEPREMWEAAYADVARRLAVPGSKARERGALGVAEFKRLARRVWPEE